MIFTLISIELYKIFRKWRTYISFGAVCVLIPLIHLSFYLARGESIYAVASLRNNFVFDGNLLNGYFVSFIVLQSLYIHIPFLIVLVGGDLMAGEATAGTYRMLITRPVSRFSIVTSKFLAGVIYALSMVFVLALLSVGLGLLIFGSGVLVVPSGQILILPETDVLWRFMAAYAFATLSMSVVVTLAFLLSSLVSNAIGPIVASMSVIIIFIIISNIPIELFESVRPYLFTNYMNGWRLFFDDPVDYTRVMKDILVLAAHVIGFYGLALFLFKRKDILT